MDIHDLQEFLVLAETKNYWEASYRLFLNQSTLSKHIKSMEAELGVLLFARTTRKVELTAFGEALLPYAKTIVRLEFEYSSKLMQMQNYQKGLITIGCLPAMAQYRITDILLDFQKQYPDNKIKIMEDDPGVLSQLLFQKNCDLVFLRETKEDKTLDQDEQTALERIPYVTDSLVAVLSLDHPFAARKEITLRDLKDEAFALLKENTVMHELCCRACQAAGFIPNIVFTSHRLDSILDMVTKSDCVALLMNRHVEYPLESAFAINPPFAVVRITPAVQTQVSLCWRKEGTLSSAAMNFIEFFRNQFA